MRRGRLSFVHPRSPIDLLDEADLDDGTDPPYWAELWASGVELARTVSARQLHGARVLELGCGLGLPSIAAALAGGRVLATDQSADAVGVTTINARRSGTVLETAVCRWDEPELLLDRAPWNLVLASDVLYSRRNATDLLELLPRLVGGSGEAWLADPGREHAGEFLDAARGIWRTVTTAGTRTPAVLVHHLRDRRRLP